MRRRADPEHREQAALFNWATIMEPRHPQLGLLFAIPNGGLRNKFVAKKLKVEGVKAGVPDTFLAVPRKLDGCFCPGLFIEMKIKPNKPTANQKEWHNKLYMEGYLVKVCYSWVEARDVIIDYLGLESRK